MELRHLRYFLAVAEERHFGRAAKRLHIAQPPLSRQIQALEQELGFPLFDRARRRVELTPAGEVFLAHVRRMFESLELGSREALRAARGESGRIVIGYLSSLAYSGLTELLRAWRARAPAVEVALREMPPAEQIEGLKEGTIDVGFLRAPVEDAALIAECVRKEPLMIALPAGHPLAAHEELPLAAIAGEPFVFFPRPRSPAYFDSLMRLCRDAGFTPRIVQEAPQLDVVSLVAAGFGVSILPSSLRNVLREGIELRPITSPAETQLLIAWRNGAVSPVVMQFVELVREVGVNKIRGVAAPARAGRGRRR